MTVLNISNVIKKATADVLVQSLSSEPIAKKMSTGFLEKVKNIGAARFVAFLMAASAGLSFAGEMSAHDSRTIGLAGSAVLGVMSNGYKGDAPIDCNVRGVDGFKVGGAAAVGSTFGSLFGQGDGKALLTAGAGIWSAAVAANKENQRIKEECERQYRERVGAQNNRAPAYEHNYRTPAEPILYEGRTQNGMPYYVTANNSKGLSSLQGTGVGSTSPDSDPVVRKALNVSSTEFLKAHKDLDQAASDLRDALNGTKNNKSARYAVTDNEREIGSNEISKNKQRIEKAKRDLDKVYTVYAQKRAVAVSIYDNAAMDGFDISEYKDALEYMTPPKSVSEAYNGNLPNRYAILPNQIR